MISHSTHVRDRRLTLRRAGLLAPQAPGVCTAQSHARKPASRHETIENSYRALYPRGLYRVPERSGFRVFLLCPKRKYEHPK